MPSTAERERVRELMTQAVTVLCQNSLTFKSNINIEGLIGITLDNDDVFLVSIRENLRIAAVSNEQKQTESDSCEDVLSSGDQANVEKQSVSRRSRPHKRKRKRVSESKHSNFNISQHVQPASVSASRLSSDTEEPPEKKTVNEDRDEIKSEPLDHTTVESEASEEEDDDLVFVKQEVLELSSSNLARMGVKPSDGASSTFGSGAVALAASGYSGFQPTEQSAVSQLPISETTQVTAEKTGTNSS